MKASSQLTSVWVSGRRGAGGAGCCSCELSDHSSPTEHGLRTRRGHPPHPASTAAGPGDEAGGSKNFRFGAGVEMERCYTIIIWSSSIHSPPTAATADPLSPEQLVSPLCLADFAKCITHSEAEIHGCILILTDCMLTVHHLCKSSQNFTQ